MSERDLWGPAARARVSDRWASAAADWNTAMTEEVLKAAKIKDDTVVLDLAAGSGDPALTIAHRLSHGTVIALDSSLAGLQLADRKALEAGLESKITCLQADAQFIPLASNSVDRVTCRCGIMFFADTRLVMSEIMRVLRPGGRVALLAWGPFEQPLFESIISTVLRLVPGSAVPAPARMMFRFAVPGSLKHELEAAGFSDTSEELITVPRIWRSSPEELWTYQQEVSTLCHPLFESIPSELRERVDSEVMSALARFCRGDMLSVPAKVILAAGNRAHATNRLKERA